MKKAQTAGAKASIIPRTFFDKIFWIYMSKLAIAFGAYACVKMRNGRDKEKKEDK